MQKIGTSQNASVEHSDSVTQFEVDRPNFCEYCSANCKTKKRAGNQDRSNERIGQRLEISCDREGIQIYKSVAKSKSNQKLRQPKQAKKI